MVCVRVTWVAVTYVSVTGVAQICRRGRMCTDRYSYCRDEICNGDADARQKARVGELTQ
jgi:hypothetical protein